MHSLWQSHLQQHGAITADDRVLHYGDAVSELRAAKSATIVCDLSHLGVIALSGDDRAVFLHAQLTSDVLNLARDASQYSGYCSPKGRLLANFLLWQSEAAIYAQLPRALLAAIQKRLAMYVLRSKVRLADASDEFARFGIAGAAAAALLQTQFGEAPRGVHQVLQKNSTGVLHLPGARFQINAPAGHAIALWNQLVVAGATAVGADAWDWLEINAGIATVTGPTQDEFVPQMLNLDAIGALSFSKGCYPGQEIVARTHYLGKLKRRMVLAHISTTERPQPGERVFSDDDGEQANGVIANAAPAPGGGFDALAVVRTDSKERRLRSPAGPPLIPLGSP